MSSSLPTAWYRFAGAGGDALPLTDPGYQHCG
eukprot:COSAG05_NODE_5982_length_1046_cov_0.974657_1_plen_31_part_10